MLIMTIMIFYLSACSNITEIEGIGIFNKDKNYKTDYIPKGKTQLSEIIENDIKDEIVVITKSGAVHMIPSNSYIDTNKDSVIVIDNDNNEIKDVKGIYISHDFHNISDAYYDAKDYLDNNEKVMVVLLDGFSYSQYKNAKESDLTPFLSQYFQNEALSVYEPVTNAGFASMITGETPDINGVHNRDYREMEVGSIFGYASSNNKKSLLLEADIKILNTEIEPVLHLDNNNDGDIDDEIFETALEVSQGDYDLVFIHFHGIDDRGHSFGPDFDETMNYIEKVDGYIRDLDQVWNGVMILTSDHGMHKTIKGGSHGLCRYEDMIVPYFKKEK